MTRSILCGLLTLLSIQFSIGQETINRVDANHRGQRGITLFLDDLVDTETYNWILPDTAITFLARRMNRNTLFLSTKILDQMDNSDACFMQFYNLVKKAHEEGMKVYGMPFSTTTAYYEPANYAEYFGRLNDRFETYYKITNRYDTLAPGRLDGLYFDIEPWATPRYRAAKATENIYQLNAIISEYKALMDTTRKYIDEYEPNYFLAYAVNWSWQRWSSTLVNTDPDYVFDDVEGGLYSDFINAGASAVVPQLYHEKEEPVWGIDFMNEWLIETNPDVSWDVTQRKEYFVPPNYVIFHLSAYHSEYNKMYNIANQGCYYLASEDSIKHTMQNSLPGVIHPPLEDNTSFFTSYKTNFLGTNLYGYKQVVDVWFEQEESTPDQK